jgi:hypothetical protein
MVAVSSTRNQRTPYIFLLREALHMDQWYWRGPITQRG